jgi:hypothetical protein
MNTKKAKEALLEGKKVRKKVWTKDKYIWFDTKNMVLYTQDEQSTSFPYTSGEFEIYKEKMTFEEVINERGVFSNGDNTYRVSIENVYLCTFHYMDTSNILIAPLMRQGRKVTTKEIYELSLCHDRVWTQV